MNRKTMTKWAAVAVVLMVLSTASFAQQPEGRRMQMDPKEMAQRTTDRLAEQLQLNQTQKDSIYKFQLARGEAMAKVFQAGQTGDREAARAKMIELRKETDKKIQSVLTTDQQAAYKKMQEERQNRGSRRR